MIVETILIWFTGSCSIPFLVGLGEGEVGLGFGSLSLFFFFLKNSRHTFI
jgi:hypothetical protein